MTRTGLLYSESFCQTICSILIHFNDKILCYYPSNFYKMVTDRCKNSLLVLLTVPYNKIIISDLTIFAIIAINT